MNTEKIKQIIEGHRGIAQKNIEIANAEYSVLTRILRAIEHFEMNERDKEAEDGTGTEDAGR